MNIQTAVHKATTDADRILGQRVITVEPGGGSPIGRVRKSTEGQFRGRWVAYTPDTRRVGFFRTRAAAINSLLEVYAAR